MLTDILLSDGEHIEDLGGGVGLLVSKSHTFGTDALLLNYFAGVKKNDKAIDLGTGCGIIPFLWLRDEKAQKYRAAAEIQSNACEQFRKSQKINNDFSLNLFEGDLKDKDLIPQREYFDVVTMNPPYKAENSGIKNGDESAKIARHETLCNIDDITECAARILRFGGRLCICHRPERTFDALFSMRKNGIEPKKIRLVQKNGETAPWLVLIDGRKGGANGLKVEKPLLMQKQDGTPTDEILEITEKYRKA